MNKSGQVSFLQRGILLTEIALLYCGFWMTHHFFNSMYNIDLLLHTESLLLTLVVAYGVFSYFGTYSDWYKKTLISLISSILLPLTGWALLIILGILYTPWFSFSLNYLITSVILQTIILSLFRVLVYSIERRKGRKRILYVGENDWNVNRFLKQNGGWYQLIGSSSDLNEEVASKYPEADGILISPRLSHVKKMEIAQFGTKYGKEVFIIPELYELNIHGAENDQIDDLMVFSIKPLKINPVQLMLKRSADVIMAFILIVGTSPLMLLLSLLIPLTSKGPALYKQERVGMEGRIFRIYKFRSMVADAEKQTGPILATLKDPRITPVGSIIRATRLDELPQLFNVLKGDMSLIGPRPEREHFVSQFEEEYPSYHYRLKVKPGITGLAQIQAKYTTSAEDKLRFDLSYVRNYSLSLDWKILLFTLKVVFHREQSHGVPVTKESKETRNALKGEVRT